MAQDLQSEDAVQGINPLLDALRLEDRSARQKEIAEILKGYDEDGVVSFLTHALTALELPPSESRKRIVEELAKIGSAKAVEVLKLIATRDSDPKVHREAVNALKQIGTDKAVDALLAVLRSFDEWRHSEAAHALESLIPVMQGMIYGTDRTSYNAMEGLVRLGAENTIDDLFQAWNSPNSIHRDRLFFLLRKFKPKRLIPSLCQRLQNKALSPDDRKTAAEMLGVIGTENEIPLLKSIWREDSDSEVSGRALRAAEQIAFSELEKKAERERALEETRAFIAHEFRHALTPLNAYVKMLDEALAQPEIDKEKLSSLTARIRKQTDTAFDLVNQYLDYSRPLSPQFEQTDVNNLLQQSLEEFKAKLENRKIVLEAQFVENAGAEVDRKMLAQVLRNVLANAIQAVDKARSLIVDKAGSLVVTTQSDEDHVSIIIRDTGTGIEPEHLPRIFEAGFTTKSGVRGVGIGLALSKRIIEEAHNGSIAIVNNTDGPGATVVINLPKTQNDENTVPHQGSEQESAKGRRGWGLKLIRSLMDEVEFESVDDTRPTKYLKEHGDEEWKA